MSGQTKAINPGDWRTIEMEIPFMHRQRVPKDCEGWLGPRVIRPTASSPFLTVSHQLIVDLTCVYDIEGQPSAEDRLTVSIPLTFVRTIPPAGRPIGRSALQDINQCTRPSLPGYTQLYDRFGDPKFDADDPLPMYTPTSAPDPTQKELAITVLSTDTV